MNDTRGSGTGEHASVRLGPFELRIPQHPETWLKVLFFLVVLALVLGVLARAGLAPTTPETPVTHPTVATPAATPFGVGESGVLACFILPPGAHRYCWEGIDYGRPDAHGRVVRVRIAHIAGPFGWSYAAVDQVRVGELGATEIPVHALFGYLNHSERRPVIAVGMASHEGNPQTEEDRAQSRADILAREAMLYLRQAPALATLNIGRCLQPRTGGTGTINERPVVLAVVIEGQDSPDLPAVIGEAMLQAFRDHHLPIDPSHYSLFSQTAEHFRWVKI